MKLARLRAVVCALAGAPAAAVAIDSIVVFNEIHYHPADDGGAGSVEFVELYNQNTVRVDLSGWRLSAGVDFVFPDGTVIGGGETLVVAADPGALEAATGFAGALGPWEGALDNGGERVRLRNLNDRVMDEVDYDDRAPWPVGADGSGATLAKRRAMTPSGEARWWDHSLEVNGTPGAANFGTEPSGGGGDPDGNVALGKTVIDGSSAYNNRAFDQVNAAGQDFRAQNVTDGSEADVFGVNYWLGSNGRAQEYFTLDLGAAYPIEEIRLRNTHNTQYNDRGTLGFRLTAATAVDGSKALVNPATILSGTLARVDGQDPIVAESFTSANGLTETTARYLKFETLSAVNNNAGLNEIEVYAADDPGGGNGGGNGGGGGEPAIDPTLVDVWINEAAGTVSGAFWIELFNAGAEAVDLEGYVLAAEDSGEIVLPAGTTIGAGEWLVVNEAFASPSGAPADGENLYLYHPGKTAVHDAVRLDDLALGRVPDGGRLHAIADPGQLTPGAANTVTVPDSIVINEVMYHHRPQYARAGDAPTVGLLEVLPWGATWRYNESGDNLGAGWDNAVHAAGGNWVEGTGPLGYETSAASLPMALATTMTNPGANDPRVITFYFETEFEVAAGDLEGVTGLRLSHFIDDGAVFYLNGQELGRYDMPDGAVTASTLAVNDTSSEANSIQVSPFPVAALVAGTNRLSVEVHQSSTGSSDVVMGVQLELERSVPGDSPPVPFVANDEEWVELTNRSGAPVDLGGWELGGAVRYEIPAGTVLAPGGFLVVARDAAAFAAAHPGVAVVGDFSGSLGNRGELLSLLDPAGNPADEVRYYDDRPWPAAADGGGSSLELVNPHTDNGLAASWAASDNAAASEWREYEVTLTAVRPRYRPGQYNFQELRIGLLEAGEVLIDDMSVVEDPDGAALELIANGTFDTASGWRFLGTHQESGVVDDGGGKVLRISASDRSNYLNNLIECNLTQNGRLHPVRVGREYRLRFRAKWLSGSPQLRLEAYYNQFAKLFVLDQPARHGTPGAQNSRYSPVAGPDLAGLVHRPAVPTSGEAIEVEVRAGDRDGVGGLTLHYRVGRAAWRSTAMGEVAGEDGLWRGEIPGQSSNALVQFYVEATDGAAVPNRSYAPAAGPDSRAVVRVATPNGGNGRQSVRINMLSAESSAMHAANDILDNHRRGCTLIIDEEHIAYDAGVRLRGSMFSRRNANTGLNLKFPADRRYRGLHSTISVATRTRKEILTKHIVNAAGGLHDNYNDLVQLNGYSGSQTGMARMEMARFSNTYLDGLPGGDGTDGTVFKMEGIREFRETVDRTPDTAKKPFPIGWISGFDLADQGDDQETYRNNLRINTGLARDDYSGIMAMAKLFSLSGAALEEAAPEVINVDMWTRQFAVLSLCGVGDTYSQGNPHNLNFYVRPDGIVEPMPWDWDHCFSRGSTSGLWGNKNVARLFARPVYTRLFHGHLHDLITHTYNADYLGDWFSHFGTVARQGFGGELSYVTSRGNYVRSRLPARVAFAVTTGGGGAIETAEPVVALEGNGWIDVREIRLEGAAVPLAVEWLDASRWRVEVPVVPGANALTLTAVDHRGNEVGTAAVNVTNTGTSEPASAGNVVVSELHYHPAGDAGEEFVELMNIHATADVDLSGVAFVNGIDFVFPAGTVLAPSERVLVVRDAGAFAAAYGDGLPVAGAFANGTSLANGGERLRLETPLGGAIKDFTYDDRAPWPASADGTGSSLVLVAPGSNPEHGEAASWRPSSGGGGAPGAGDSSVFPGGDVVAYALGDGGGPQVEVGGDGGFVVSFPRRLSADDVEVVVELSANLVDWAEDPARLAYESVGLPEAGVATVRYRAELAALTGRGLFVRLLVRERE